MTKEDLQKQREQEAWISGLIDVVKSCLVYMKVVQRKDVGTYEERGGGFYRFTIDGKLWELSIKEKKPRKKKSNGTK